MDFWGTVRSPSRSGINLRPPQKWLETGISELASGLLVC
jgi:hypothetical protein